MLPKSEHCIARVPDRTSTWGHMYNCSRKATKDGYCFQHHPDALKAKKDKEAEASNRRFKARDAISDASESLAKVLVASSVHPVVMEAIEAFFKAADEYHAVKYAQERTASELLGFAMWHPLNMARYGKDTTDGNND